MHKRNMLSFAIIGLLCVTMLLSIGMLSASLIEGARIRKEIASRYKLMESYAKRSKMPISKGSIAVLTDERNSLKSIYTRFKLALMSPLNEEVPEEDMDPLQFKERLVQTQKKLREDAARNGLSLPEALGFAEYETELSERAEIPDLIAQLKVLEELIAIMALTGIDSLRAISFGELPHKTGLKEKGLSGISDKINWKEVRRKVKEGTRESELLSRMEKEIGKRKSKSQAKSVDKKNEKSYFDIPVSFALGCASQKFMDFLYQLRLSPYAFIIDDMDVVKLEEGSVDDIKGEELMVRLAVKAVALN